MGFYLYQNDTESLGDRLLRCRWGGVGAPTTPPTRVNDGLVVCDSAVGATAGTVPLYVALNDADYIDTGFSFTHYEQVS